MRGSGILDNVYNIQQEAGCLRRLHDLNPKVSEANAEIPCDAKRTWAQRHDTNEPSGLQEPNQSEDPRSSSDCRFRVVGSRLCCVKPRLDMS